MTRFLKASVGFCLTASALLAAPAAFAAGEGGGTLPQLEIGTFPTQVFWLFVTFAVLYIAMSKVAIPRIADVLEERQERIADDLEKAEKMKADAEEVRANYEQALADARAESLAQTRKTADEIAAANAKAEAAAAKEAADRVKAAEDSIAAARAEALANVKGMASEVAGEAVKKLIGVTVSASDLDKAVGKVMEAR